MFDQEAQGTTPSPSVAPAPSAPVQGATIGSLQAQVAELRIQLAGMEAQWSGLKSQLDVMLKTNPARPGVQQQWADVGVHMAQTKGDIASLEARIAEKQGRPVGTTSPPSGPPRGSFDPNVAIPAATVLLLAFVLPISLAWARRIWRGKPQPAGLPLDQVSRLERMEQALDAVAIEVERVSEGQRFVTKIFAQAPARPVIFQSADAPLADDKPPLVLGAGPAEPIRMPEREAMRQRVITPH